MADMRDRLIELLEEADDLYLEKLRDAESVSEILKIVKGAYERYADHILASDVILQEWISVKDRLPTREDANETESILAINKDEKHVGRWAWDIVARWPTEFTYWMSLPQPPKGAEKALREKEK